MKFTLLDDADGITPINATQLIFNDGTNKYTVNTATATNVFYVAIPGFSGRDIKLDAVAGTNVFSFTKTGVTFENGKYYTITVKMAKILPPEGALRGKFSISSSTQVYFSKGNLQWSATGGGESATTHDVNGGGTASGTWRFAEHQYDFIFKDGPNGASSGRDTQAGWIDLFGWATSGWDNGNDVYLPWEIRSSGNQTNGYGYGPFDGSSSQFDLTGTYANADWGVYNAISNGGNTPGQWRTLSSAEWNYLLKNEERGDYRYLQAQITVGGSSYKGLIIFPDTYDGTIGSYTYNTATYANYSWFTSVSEANWNAMEAIGATFLPSAGFRSGTNPIYIQEATNGYYWSTSHDSNTKIASLCLYVANSGANPSQSKSRTIGASVRLVYDVK